MQRPPRVFVEDGIYHVYNRVTRGERVFAEDQEAKLLLDAMRKARDRDGLIVLAWCIMGNHYHLAVRCGPVPLWRTMASIHTRVGKGYNARYRFYGPFWQGRYRAKLTDRNFLFSTSNVPHLPTRDLGPGTIDSRPFPST